mgnify:CR=1 FL=1
MSIPDRIGGQGVIKVLSNISGSSVSKLLDLSDVSAASLADGYFLEYNANTSKFITTDTFRFVKNINVTDTVTTQNLDVTGITTFRGDLFVGSDLYVNEYLIYGNNFDGPNGVGYFDDQGRLVGASSTENAVNTSNFILTTDAVGIPTWTNSIDGGVY